MSRLPVPERHRAECDCYGEGCSKCAGRGWHETEEGREEREAEEDRRADEARERRMLGDDW